jgi:hypothetical protein
MLVSCCVVQGVDVMLSADESMMQVERNWKCGSRCSANVGAVQVGCI